MTVGLFLFLVFAVWLGVAAAWFTVVGVFESTEWLATMWAKLRKRL